VQRLHRLSEIRQEGFYLAAAGTGQHEKIERLALTTRRAILALPPYLRQLLAVRQRVAHIMGRRPPELLHDIRLERENGQHMIDVGRHFCSAFRPPGPYGRRNIFYDRNVRQRLLNALRNAVRKIRAVDQDNDIGPRRNHGLRCLIDPHDQTRQARDDRCQTDQRDFRRIEDAVEAPFAQSVASDPDQFWRMSGLLGDCINEIDSQILAGDLSCDQSDNKGPVRRHWASAASP
jgi:hypothetical protein